jgi:O-antigen/teichoic acid export membrane protein
VTAIEPAEPGQQAKKQAADNAGVEAGRGALFIGFAKIYFMISGSLQQLVLPRLVDAASFGAFGVVNNLVSIVNNTMVQATVQSISKFTAEDDRRQDAVKRAGLKMQLVVGGVLGLVFFLGAPLLAAFEKAPGYARYFRIAAAIPFLYALYAVFVGSANGLRRFRTQASFDVGFSTAKTILLLGLAAIWQVTGAFAGFVAAAVVILIASARVMGVPALRVSADAGGVAGGDEASFPASRLIAFMGAVVAYSLLVNVALNYDQPLLRRFAGMAVDGLAADHIAGHYQGLRTLALLPYQALLVITFVIFPLVSRATFAADRDATRTYINQTLRYALILAVAMGLCLGARPAALLAIVYRPEYGEGAPALPILVAGECCLALLAVSCAILNAAGRALAAVALMLLTLAVGVGAAFVLVPAAAPGAPMLVAAATSTALGMAAGFVASVIYLRSRLGGGLPLATVLRVGISAVAAALVGRFVPGHGKVAGLAAIAAVGVVYLGGLVVTGELGADDRAKLMRILRRR